MVTAQECINNQEQEFVPSIEAAPQYPELPLSLRRDAEVQYFCTSHANPSGIRIDPQSGPRLFDFLPSSNSGEYLGEIFHEAWKLWKSEYVKNPSL